MTSLRTAAAGLGLYRLGNHEFFLTSHETVVREERGKECGRCAEKLYSLALILSAPSAQRRLRAAVQRGRRVGPG